MRAEFGTPPERLETAGIVEQLAGDIDTEPEDSSLTVLDPEGEIGSDQGGTPGDAAGASGISGG